MVLVACLFMAISFALLKNLQGQDATNYGAKLFKKKMATLCGPLRLGAGWIQSSRTNCAISCTKRYPKTCRSVMYNEITKLCTPGSGVTTAQRPPSSKEGDLYVTDSCGSYPEFGLSSYNSTTAFIAYFPAPVNYSQASATCQCLDSHLYVAKTLEKSAIFSNLSVTCTWLGLDDIQVEGQFVWSDDNQPIDPLMLRTLFLPNRPDNHLGQQDCAMGCGQKLDDIECKLRFAYICEKSNSLC